MFETAHHVDKEAPQPMQQDNVIVNIERDERRDVLQCTVPISPT